MNEQTIQLIQQYSDKLGTTAEKLWSVLVAQAPISAATSLGFILLLTVITLISGKAVARAYRDMQNSYNDEPLRLFFFAVCFGISAIMLVAWTGSKAEAIAAGFFNPEYWALHKLISLR